MTRGFLEGPHSEDEMMVLLETDQWSLNPRFVLFQGASRKVRIIDDAKKSCVNDAYSSTVKLQLQDVDYVDGGTAYPTGRVLVKWDMCPEWLLEEVLPFARHSGTFGVRTRSKRKGVLGTSGRRLRNDHFPRPQH